MENRPEIRAFRAEEISPSKNKWITILESIVRELDNGQEFAGYYTGVSDSENKEKAITIRVNIGNYLRDVSKKNGKKLHSSLRFYVGKSEDENAPHAGYWIIFSYSRMPKSRNVSEK